MGHMSCYYLFRAYLKAEKDVTNDNLCIYDEESDSFRINIQNTLTENLKLEIVNRTENIIQVNNPYILFSY